ncbi:hypothetical protein J8L86_20835 [Shewanella sp. MMG014]|uniref:hypothetical protein n=1 Tax=Shewanella sp. MMG014 TaxID=2822691 RepID=UPI001B3794B3|nr:hypothetical protein [Shewanella sp. MMG014]MBQ4892299.1 hypothetical protein [Shewanella sp. MMG014]
MRNKWQSWIKDLTGQWYLLIDIDEPLKLVLPIYLNEQNAQHKLATELHYRPSVNSNEIDIIRFQTEQLTRFEQLTEVSLFKISQLNTPLAAFNLDSLYSSN